MLFRMVYDETLAQAAYVIGCQATGEAIVVDPERDVDRYLDVAAGHGLRITAVAETHIHADFLSGARELAERVGATVYLSGEGGEDWGYRWPEAADGAGAYRHRLLKHADTFAVGNIAFKAIHTPGHTPEHLSYEVVDGRTGGPMGLITGDFVFVGDLGRPDLLETAVGIQGVAASSAEQLRRSTQAFRTMPEYLQVWPAHGAGSACGKSLGAVPQSTVGYELRHNRALALADDADSFVRFVLENQPEPPLYFPRMKRLNRDGVPVLGSLPSPTERDASELGRLSAEGVVVVDTRPWTEFRGGHLPGSLFAPRGATFATVLGSYVEPDQRICFVVDGPEELDDAVRNAIRIGYDHVVGWIGARTLDAYERSGGVLEDLMEIDGAELGRRIDAGDDVYLLDVRGAREHAEHAIPGAVNIAHTRLPTRLGEVPKDHPVVLHCHSGGRSAAAASYLKGLGYHVENVSGGIMGWAEAHADGARAAPTQ